ncbi:MAG: FG-GAP repeat protein, partial [Planctomycetota bacterium]|nr:FG-GAP repeat protein [Planctomycetota bacterium]
MSLVVRWSCCFVALAIGATGAVANALELVATNPVGATGDKNGWDVGIDGDTIIVGQIGPAGATGTARVYVNDGSNWTYQASLVPAGSIANDLVGHGVAIQGDTAVVGVRDYSSATVFTRYGTTWTEGKTLLGPLGGRFGNSVAIDGDWIAVGASANANCFVSNFDGANWTDPIVLDRSAATLGVSKLGYDVAVDGDWIFGGAFLSNAVHIWKYDSGTEQWDYHSGIDNGADDGYFGIALDVDGDRAIVGARNAGGNDGKAYTYTYNSGTDAWELEQTLDGELGSGELFGSGVSLSGDMAVIGAYNADVNGQVNSGAAYMYKLSGGTWSLDSAITPATPIAGGTFGNSVDSTDSAIVVG